MERQWITEINSREESVQLLTEWSAIKLWWVLPRASDKRARRLDWQFEGRGSIAAKCLNRETGKHNEALKIEKRTQQDKGEKRGKKSGVRRLSEKGYEKGLILRTWHAKEFGRLRIKGWLRSAIQNVWKEEKRKECTRIRSVCLFVDRLVDLFYLLAKHNDRPFRDT